MSKDMIEADPKAGSATIFKLLSLLVALAAAFALLFVGESSASAASSSYLYNQHGSTVLTTCSQACGSVGTPYYAPNGTGAHMVCYYDGPNSFTGNYTSNRFYMVNLSSRGGQWFVHSSYVYYQTSVPRC